MAQLEAQEAKARARADAANRQVRMVQAQRRKVEEEVAHQRRLEGGTLLEELGLLRLDDDTLSEVLRMAVRLVTERPEITRNGTHPEAEPVSPASVA
jgi:hypothetical protein